MLRALSLVLLVVAVRAAGPVPDFLREVRPLLANQCLKCHGPDEAARKGDLRLDLRAAAILPAKSGKIAIVPGKPEASELVIRVTQTDPDEVMPPASTRHALTDVQKDLLRGWVAAGAEYQPHWAFIAPRRAPVPAGAAHPIDGFIQARLAAEGLKFSPAADRYTLARRVSLDLIGLPPSPDEAEQFAQDTATDAYEKFVDHLLASPHYGERWARRWLDLARYADSNGYEKDRSRNIWPWRDWVIRTLNADVPFDRFSIAQLAGDLLPGATRDDLIATGFHRNTMLNEEGGIDPLEFRFHAMTDRVSTTATTWLGMTMACAQCHTHKYDPITQREYYQFMAFLDNCDEPDFDLPEATAPAQQAQRQRNAEKLERELPSHWPLADVTWSSPPPAVSTDVPDSFLVLADGSVRFKAPGPDSVVTTFVLESDEGPVDRLRLEALADPELPSGGPGRVQHGNFVLNEITIAAMPRSGGTAETVTLSTATADVEQEGFSVSKAFDGDPTTGWSVHAKGHKLGETRTAVFQFVRPIKFQGGTRFTITLTQKHGSNHTIGRPRLSLGSPVEDARPEAERREQALTSALSHWLTSARAAAVPWRSLRPSSAKSNLPLLTIESDNSIFASGDFTKDDTYELKWIAPAGVTAVRLEALPDGRLPGHGPGITYYEGPKGDFFLGEFSLQQDGRTIPISTATASFEKNHFGGSATAMLAVDGDPQTGWSCGGQSGRRNEAVFVLAKPLAASGELTIKLRFGRHFACSLGRFRLSTTSVQGATAQTADDSWAGLLLKPDDALTERDRSELRTHFLLQAREIASFTQPIRELLTPLEPLTTLVLRERPPENPRPTYFRKRGEYLQPTQRVEAGAPAFLPAFPAGATRNRLEFARWLMAPENPLVARVTVNREWSAFFGTGFVRTTGDFGFQGELPSHPELLDWLAVEWVHPSDGGTPWSLKRLHRLIVTSRTYQQSSQTRPELRGKDPQNRLLARGPRFRLEAEMIRDSVLAASGLLAPKLYGPSVRPSQPDGVTETAYGSPSWEPSQGEDRYRRSLYTFQKRTAPFALFSTFDAPSGESCLARREVSNTPLQSLTLLNDPAIQEAALALAGLVLGHSGDDSARAIFALRRILVRPPNEVEITRLIAFVTTQRQRLQAGELSASQISPTSSGEPLELAAWTLAARALLNLDEFISKP